MSKLAMIGSLMVVVPLSLSAIYLMYQELSFWGAAVVSSVIIGVFLVFLSFI